MHSHATRSYIVIWPSDCTYVHIHAHTYIDTQRCMHAYIHTYMQVCEGMQALTGTNIVRRDLAARNVYMYIHTHTHTDIDIA